MSTDPTVLVDVADRVATLTLNRPHRLNAWTGRMDDELRTALAACDGDDSVRAIVITGAGRGFCAGADAKALDKHSSAGAYDSGLPPDPATPGYGVRPDFDHPYAYLLGIPKPVIAAVNGPAAGVGLVLACFCDMRFAAEGAKLTTSSARLGLPAEYGLSWLLPRLIGAGRAAELLFSSRVVLAEEAERIGLVNRVLPPEQLLPETLGFARMLASELSPASLRETKRQLWSDLLRPLDDAMRDAIALLDRMVAEPDFREGAAALSEKRPPRF